MAKSDLSHSAQLLTQAANTVGARERGEADGAW